MPTAAGKCQARYFTRKCGELRSGPSNPRRLTGIQDSFPPPGKGNLLLVFSLETVRVVD